MPGPLTVDVVAALGAAVACAVGGGLVPGVVGALPRPRDIAEGEPGPDYTALSHASGLRPVSVTVGGLLGLAVGVRLGADRLLPAACFLVVTGTVLSFVDLREHRLPDALVGRSAGGLAVLLGLAAVLGRDAHPLARAALGALATAGLLLLAVLARPGGLGLGDVKLGGLTGALLGWLSWSAVVAGLLVGLTLGAVAGLVLVAARRATRHTAIPLGPALLAGALLVVLLHGP